MVLKMAHLTVYLPKELKEKIRKLAYERRTSQSAVTVELLQERIAKMEREEDYEPDTLFEVGLLEKHIHTLENE